MAKSSLCVLCELGGLSVSRAGSLQAIRFLFSWPALIPQDLNNSLPGSPIAERILPAFSNAMHLSGTVQYALRSGSSKNIRSHIHLSSASPCSPAASRQSSRNARLLQPPARVRQSQALALMPSSSNPNSRATSACAGARGAP